MATPLKALIQERLRAKIVRQEAEEEEEDEGQVVYLSTTSPSFAPLIDPAEYMVPPARSLYDGDNNRRYRDDLEDDPTFMTKTYRVFDGYDQALSLPRRDPPRRTSPVKTVRPAKWRYQHPVERGSRRQASPSEDRVYSTQDIASDQQRVQSSHPRRLTPPKYYYGADYCQRLRSRDAEDNNNSVQASFDNRERYSEGLTRTAPEHDYDTFQSYQPLTRHTVYPSEYSQHQDQHDIRTVVTVDRYVALDDQYDLKTNPPTPPPTPQTQSEFNQEPIYYPSTNIPPALPSSRITLPLPSPLDMALVRPVEPRRPDSRVGATAEQLSRIRVYDDILSPDSRNAAKAFVEKRQRRSKQSTPRTMATQRWLQSVLSKTPASSSSNGESDENQSMQETYVHGEDYSPVVYESEEQRRLLPHCRMTSFPMHRGDSQHALHMPTTRFTSSSVV
ncbi:hypothetical protein Poli38472_007474 [Pythium oligandrum]|uniref:Uncharacterized protein n=1 Tax=Pythium oligandrum TaxID=41045 RepID=A0A8K1FQC4_PYTOL|nr:hypothetical protein Poli38472_007474 [Pythium oligandrum]|eukprot:TMW67802.1 hypothetical protein Poli38472_007474 [Pythium oligandrum]